MSARGLTRPRIRGASTEPLTGPTTTSIEPCADLYGRLFPSQIGGHTVCRMLRSPGLLTVSAAEPNGSLAQTAELWAFRPPESVRWPL